MVFSALNVNFRDIKYASGVCDSNRNLQYSCVYTIRDVPLRCPWLAGLKPVSGGGSDFPRKCLLGNNAWWKLIGMSFGVSLVLFSCGLFIFQCMERRFADIV